MSGAGAQAAPSLPSTSSRHAHLASPVAPMGQGWMAGWPAGVQSHCSWRAVFGGHDDDVTESSDDVTTNRLLTDVTSLLLLGANGL